MSHTAPVSSFTLKLGGTSATVLIVTLTIGFGVLVHTGSLNAPHKPAAATAAAGPRVLMQRSGGCSESPNCHPALARLLSCLESSSGL
jgi:hypothetical protein